MNIHSPSASTMTKPLTPWTTNGKGPMTKPLMFKPTPKPTESNPVKPLMITTTKPLAVPPKGPAIGEVAEKMNFKPGAALQTSGLENNALSVATPNVTAQPLSLEGLAKAWGTNNTEYDFTGDGTVNVQDLLYMMDNWEQFRPNATLQTAPNGQLVTADSPVLVTNSAMIETKMDLVTAEDAAIGESTTDVVPDESKPDPVVSPESSDATDLEPSEPPVGETEPAPTPEPEPQTPSTDDSLNLRGYLDSLRGADSRRTTLEGLNGVAARAAIAPGTVRGNGAAKGMGGLMPLADSLFSHLSSAGFADQPPTNIRELVDALNLAPRQTDFLLRQLTMKYPQGLGVNVIG
jgi:hypothetical protein